MTSEYFGPVQDVAFGIGDSFDYDRFKLWIENQQWNFKKSFTIQGDIISANWNGASPLDLSTEDTTASAGFALDSSVGSLQLEGDMFLGGDMDVGGSIDLKGAGVFRTDTSGERLEIDASTGSSFIEVYNSSGTLVGYMGYAPTGYGSDELVISTEAGTDSVRIHADGNIELEPDGEAGVGVQIKSTPNGGSPGKILWVLDGSSNEVFTATTEPSVWLDGYTMIGSGFADGWPDDRPWSRSHVLISDHLAIGTHGSYRGSIDWNWYRGTGGNNHNGLNSYDEWASIWMDPNGISFAFQSGTFDGIPDMRVRVQESGLFINENGSASDPVIQFNDTNTGPFKTGAGSIAWSVNGSTVFIIGSDDHIYIHENFDSIGNHETLRADRTVTGETTQVGYYSSWSYQKKFIRPVNDGRRWDRSWFMDLEPVGYERRRGHHSDRDKDGYRPIELGFTIENLIENTNLLTTRGNRVGDSPDEYAILAVTVDYVQHLERRVAALERKLVA